MSTTVRHLGMIAWTFICPLRVRSKFRSSNPRVEPSVLKGHTFVLNGLKGIHYGKKIKTCDTVISNIKKKNFSLSASLIILP